jgi:hypothetical protein
VFSLQAHVARLPGLGVPVMFGSGFRLVMPERSVKLESLTLVDEAEEDEEEGEDEGEEEEEDDDEVEDPTGGGKVCLRDVVAVEGYLEVLVIKTRLVYGSLDQLEPLKRSICRLDIEAPSDVSGKRFPTQSIQHAVARASFYTPFLAYLRLFLHSGNLGALTGLLQLKKLRLAVKISGNEVTANTLTDYVVRFH